MQMTVFCPSHGHPRSSHQLVAGRVPPAPSLHPVFSRRPSQTRMTSPETPNVPSVRKHHPASGSVCPSAERSRSEGDRQPPALHTTTLGNTWDLPRPVQEDSDSCFPLRIPESNQRSQEEVGNDQAAEGGGRGSGQRQDKALTRQENSQGGGKKGKCGVCRDALCAEASAADWETLLGGPEPGSLCLPSFTLQMFV